MSRIQKRRQLQGAKETPASEDGDEESSRGGRGDVGIRRREIEGENTTGTLSGRRERNRNAEDEKPKSDDENENERRKKDGLKLDIDPPADLKPNLNVAADEEKPLTRRPPRGGGTDKITNPLQDGKDGSNGGGDVETNKDTSEVKQLEKDLEKGPLKILQPLRTDPLGAMKNRHKKLERLTAESVPEIHFIGKILSGENIVMDKSEGGTCRWRVESTPCWIHLGGELQGQTHVVYARKDHADSDSTLPFDHPLDLHFGESGIPGWGTPRLCVQTYRLDIHGRRILGGYGFTHFPMTQGFHTVEISLWRPVGTSTEEMESYLLGRVPALLSSDPIYETAWQDRERLMTTTAGTVVLQINVLTRFMYKQNIDPPGR